MRQNFYTAAPAEANLPYRVQLTPDAGSDSVMHVRGFSFGKLCYVMRLELDTRPAFVDAVRAQLHSVFRESDPAGGSRPVDFLVTPRVDATEVWLTFKDPQTRSEVADIREPLPPHPGGICTPFWNFLGAMPGMYWIWAFTSKAEARHMAGYFESGIDDAMRRLTERLKTEPRFAEYLKTKRNAAKEAQQKTKAAEPEAGTEWWKQ